MANYILVGNKKYNFQQTMMAINRLKSLTQNRNIKFTWALTKDNKLFYIYDCNGELVAETIMPNSQIKGIKDLEDNVTYSTNGLSSVIIGSVEYHYHKSTSTLYIDYIETIPFFTGKKGMGIGTQMMNVAKAVAKKKGATTITLDRLCVYDNNGERFVYRGNSEDNEKIKKMKKENMPLIDVNLQFYLKNGFVNQHNRRPMNSYLVPMYTNKFNFEKPVIKNSQQIIYPFMIKKHQRKVYDGNCVYHIKKNDELRRLTLLKFHALDKKMLK